MMKRASLAFAVALLTAAPAAADAVRFAARDGYGRVAFEWDQPVRYSADIVGGDLVVQFERAVSMTPAPLAQALGAYISGAPRISPDQRTIAFPLRPNVTMRTFTVGSAVVVDLVAAPAQTAKAKPAAPASPNAPAGARAVAVRTGQHPTFFRVAFDWPQSRPGYRVERRGENVAVIFQGTGTINLASLNQRLPAANKGASVSYNNGQTTLIIPHGAALAVNDLATGNTIAIDLTNSPASQQQASVTRPAEAAKPPAAKPAAATPEPQVAAAKPAPPPAPRPLQGSQDAAAALKGQINAKTEVDAAGNRVTRSAANNRVDPLTSRPAEISLTIPWTEPSAAAVFRRAEFLWVVFDRYQQVDVAKLAKEGAPYITFVEQLPYRNNTILRMVTRPDINPTTRRDGLNWVLDFRALPLRPTQAIDVNAQLERPQPNLFLPITEAGRTVAVEDPEVGDYLLIIPVIPLSYGVYPERSFAEVDLPATAQGVVVVPKADGVRAQASRNGVDIDVDGGMALSRDGMQVAGALGGDDDMQRLLNIADWQIGRADDYVRNKQALQYALGDERPDTRQQARLRLARFEFVNGFYPEVLGILRVMAANDEDVENTAQFRALRGAALFMMRRYQEAAEDFNHFTLANEEDARFWLAASRSQISDPKAQAETMIQTGALIRAYPRRVKIPLALMGVEATIAAGDDFGAQGFLDMVRKETPSVNELAAIDYMDGKLNEKIGELQVALQQFKKAENSQSLMYSVLATRDRLELEHKLGTVTTAQLVEGLEQLRYRWRGDHTELEMLLRLADLYGEEKDYGTALRTLKITTSYFSGDERVNEAANKMTGIFEKLYLDGEADKLSPVTAIGLFEEFRSLVPPGDKGDEMIRKLADRLVSVDLLQQAALLLERQVQFRVTGVDRSRIGSRLALIYLLDEQPQKALDVLNDTTTPEAGRELNAQRRRLEARALTDLNKVDEAVLLLGTDTTPETKQLRAEIYWRAQQWSNAAAALSELAPEPEGTTLSDQNARIVLDWATALTLAGDERTLVRVRQRYTVPMSDTPYRDAFSLITTPRERGVMDVAAVRQQIEQAEQFKSFMVDYKDMIGEKPLSQIN
ncbi:MAG: tetratricopeptide repeat protein [Rhodospirillaceae bacterium]